jgi:hypothetical protein
MTFREALRILINNAAQNQAGAGCGIRSLQSDAERVRIAQAIRNVWPKAYGFPMGDSERLNLGLMECEGTLAPPTQNRRGIQG